MSNYAFIIPCLNPNQSLVLLVSELIKSTQGYIIIVDDGSDKCTERYFKSILENKSYGDRIILLQHHINMGKGAALKTAFKYILDKLPEVKFAITLDCDGQHSVKDCLNILQAIKENPDCLILGCRQFTRKIPLRNYIGNKVSNIVYSIILGVSLKDSQTGLRALNREMMKECLKIPFNRYEFETEQLIHLLKRKKVNVIQIPIATIYYSNQSSHFNTVLDSFRIYFVLFRYFLSSLVTSLIDLLFFVPSLSLTNDILYANLISRFFALIFQFYILRKFVFKVKTYLLIRFISFAIYVLLMGIVSANIQIHLYKDFNFGILTTKILVESILFFINFAILKVYIFNKIEENEY
jgi:glycosyltransferase involved in cell wall biosynthesis